MTPKLETQMEEELLRTNHNGVLTLTMNRPARRNALSLTLYQKLREALEQASTDSSVGAVVLTGAGNAFSAGGDVARMAARQAQPLSVEERVATLRRRMGISELLHEMDKPTIAMIRGAAVGAGFSIALACDLRFADSSAKLSTGFIKVALSGDFGGHYFLQKIVGTAKARELYLRSPILNAEEALKLGLVNEVVPDAQLPEHVRSIAQALADGPRTAISCMKKNLNFAEYASLGDMLDAEAMRHVRCVDTADHREAAKAFVEKRPPKFGMADPDQFT
jgi:2-(1,2-epoxy-1,2-dihydrophenyl)acetyl-CoA isomerase